MIFFLFYLFPTFFLSNSKVIHCDVVIIGGSLSAFSASIGSAMNGAFTCLVEPTDWIGGQTTSSAVSAIDFAWHVLTDPDTGKKYPVYKYARDPKNWGKVFQEIIERVPDTGNCWVSQNCFLPQTMLEKGFGPLLEEVGDNLRIFYNSVIRRAAHSNKRVTSIDVVQRERRKNSTHCHLLSEDLHRWYDEEDDAYYTKMLYTLKSHIFIEGSEWGELLSVTNSEYLQGIAEKFDGDVSKEGNEMCGQSATFGFVEGFTAESEPEPPNPYPVHHPEWYNLDNFTLEAVWDYRRLLDNSRTATAAGNNGFYSMNVGDLCLQNWGNGNDYAFSYMLKSYHDTQRDVKEDKWQGGIDKKSLKEAEYLAFGYHYYFKDVKKELLKDRIYLEKSILGSCHGLSKVPYIRDTRRAIGIDEFVMKVADISGNFMETLTGKVYHDRVALGVYDVDIHSIEGCVYPDYMHQFYPILPFYIPFRAMTTKSYQNVLVTGKCLAQSFLVNSATRVHPVEFSSGLATGIIASWMSNMEVHDTRRIHDEFLQVVQSEIERFAPIDWTIDYPVD